MPSACFELSLNICNLMAGEAAASAAHGGAGVVEWWVERWFAAVSCAIASRFSGVSFKSILSPQLQLLAVRNKGRSSQLFSFLLCVAGVSQWVTAEQHARKN